MTTSTLISIPKLKFHEPRRNLPNKSSLVRTELNFTLKFARAYISQIELLHHGTTRTEVDFAREIPINGYGIADFVAVFWDPHRLNKNNDISNSLDFYKSASPIIRAFELKISNWRKALMQAYSYRYFADASIVVLPIKKIQVAADYLTTFRKINVGLWGFNHQNNHITQLYTPRPITPFEPGYKLRAIELVAKASKSRHFV